MKIKNLLSTTGNGKPKVSESVSRTVTDIKNTFSTTGRNLGMETTSVPDVFRKQSGKSFVKKPVAVNVTYEKIEKDPNEKSYGLMDRVLDVLVRNQEKSIRRYETDRSFREEIVSEDARRHNELIRAIKEFATIRTTTAEPVKVEQKSWWEKIKSFIDDILSPFKIIRPFLDILKAVAKWPVIKWLLRFTSIGSLAAALATYSKEVSPGTLYDAEGNPTDDYRNILIKDKQNFKRPFGSALPNLVSDIESDTTGSNKGKWEQEMQKGTKLFQDEASALKEQYDIDWPIENIINKKNIGSMKYQATDNQKFIPKYSYPDAPEMNTAAARARGAAAMSGEFQKSEGRSASSFIDERLQNFTPQNDDSEPPAQQVQPLQIPTVPETSTVNQVISENNDLSLERKTAQVDTLPPIINSNTNNNALPDTPPSSTAAQRDDTPILARAFRQSMALV